jgi:hypothetical protein
MLANAARASRALDDDAHEISTRRLAYWRRAHRRAQKRTSVRRREKLI